MLNIFGETITSVLDWTPIILCEKYHHSMKYHIITTDGGGSTKYHSVSHMRIYCTKAMGKRRH